MPPSSGSACNNHAPPRSAWRSLSPLAPCGWRWHGSRCYEDNRPGVSAVCRVTSFRVWLYDPRRPTSEPVLRSLARLRFQRNTGTAKAKRLTRLKRPKNSPPIRAQEPGCGARYSLQRCRKQGAVHATGCKVQEAGCGAPCSSQRCRKQGAVHGLRVRCTPQAAKVQEAGWGARHSLQRCRNQGAVHGLRVQEAGWGCTWQGAGFRGIRAFR